MDQQQATQVSPATPKQRDLTKWIVIALLIVASIGTGIAYLIFTNPDIKNSLYVGSPSPTPSSQRIEQNTESTIALQTLKKYTSTEHGFSFSYYATWFLAQKPDNRDFVLQHVSTTDPGIIEGRFLSSKERTKNYCEQNRKDTKHCWIYEITANRELIMDTSNYIETGKLTALMLHPTQGALVIDVTDPNFESYTVLQQMLSTMQFTDEARIVKLPFCPDKWSEDKKTGFLRGIDFDAKDIDERCI